MKQKQESMIFNDTFFRFLNNIKNNHQNKPSYKIARNIVSDNTILRYVKYMDEKGIIIKERDGRKNILRLTKIGEELLDNYNSIINKL